MKIIEVGKENRIYCSACHSTYEFDSEDLKWVQTEHNKYYVICPVCGHIHWMRETDFLNKMWFETHKQ